MDVRKFIENLPVLADAPGGIKRLRELVLELAVRGKLVEQRVEDGEAADLLFEVQKQRDKQIQSKAIKRVPLSPKVAQQEVPFLIPDSWRWTRLGETGTIFNGNSVNASDKESIYAKVREGYPYVATKDVGYGWDELHYETGLRIPHDAKKFKIAHAGAILMCSEGGSAGKKCGLTKKDISFGNKLYANETWNGIESKFLLSLYQTPFFFEEFASKMTGIIGGIAIKQFLLIPVPLPPAAEQKRIVEQVDRLMAFLDELEAKQKARNQTKLLLGRSALGELEEAQSPAEAMASWKRVSENATWLFRSAENLKRLRQTILQLAVQGKLVEQDPNDEPASELLKRIEAKNMILVRHQKKYPSFSTGQIDLPCGWIHCYLEQVLQYPLQNGYSPKPVNYPTKVKSLTLSATTSGHFNPIHYKYIDEEVGQDSQFWLEPDDILIQRGNSLEYVGIAAIFDGPQNSFIFPDLMIRLRLVTSLEIGFILLCLNSPEGRTYFQSNAIGTSGSMPKINQGIVKKFLIPLPPLAEQKRIVAKVNSLLATLDQAEAALAESTKTAELFSRSACSHVLEAS